MKKMMTKKVQDWKKLNNMLSTEIESFRMNHGMTVKEFCILTHMPHSQYSKYINGRKSNLTIVDALRLSAAFPDQLSVNKLLRMSGEKPLKISKLFPVFSFSENPQTDRKETETVFKNFVTKAAFEVLAPDDAVSILASFLQPCSDDEIFLPMKENMIYLTSNLRRIRNIKYTAFSFPRRTVTAHLQQSVFPVRFSDICDYERVFRSGGIFLLSELIYINEKKKIGITLRQKDIM